MAHRLANASYKALPEEIFTIGQAITIEEWQTLSDIGPKVAEALFNWFHDNYNYDLMCRLSRQGVTAVWEEKLASQALSGKIFVFTGRLNSLTRAQAEARIKQAG